MSLYKILEEMLGPDRVRFKLSEIDISHSLSAFRGPAIGAVTSKQTMEGNTCGR